MNCNIDQIREVRRMAAEKKYYDQELGGQYDQEIAKMVTSIMDGDLDSVSSFIGDLTPEDVPYLRYFSERMASISVRNHDADSLEKSCYALMICLEFSSDRDSLMVCAVLSDAAHRLKINLIDWFSCHKNKGFDAAIKIFSDFENRPENLRSLSSMGYLAEDQQPEKFQYSRKF